MDKIKVAVIFGGPSREREISFAGGRTVYDNLDKNIFEAIPVFVDSFKQFILLDWQYVYKGSIRDFYPPIEDLPPSKNGFQVYVESIEGLDDEAKKKMASKIGTVITAEGLKDQVDVAFLALHGAFGEDGQIQAILDSLEIPYTGSGVLPSAIGMDKTLQKEWMEHFGFASVPSLSIPKRQWKNPDQRSKLIEEIAGKIGNHYVIRPAHQGSSIGVSILKEPSHQEVEQAIGAAFFIKSLSKNEWELYTEEEKIQWLKNQSDIRDGIGMPLYFNEEIIYHPEELLEKLNAFFAENNSVAELKGQDSEEQVLLESFIDGKEFSCIVIRQEDGTAMALPPTEIIKGDEVFDYRSKYLPGLSRKLTPIHLEDNYIKKIQKECIRLFEVFKFNTYARIDGFFMKDGTVFLNDPNTTSGMLPSSFFFHQAAELGLNPSQLISFIIRQSVQERIDHSQQEGLHQSVLKRLDKLLGDNQSNAAGKIKIGVILGGYSFERHISVESGRNVYEKLASSDKYEPIPIFLIKNDDGFDLYQIPINLLLKDNADDIRDKVLNFKLHPLIESLRVDGKSILDKYLTASTVLAPQLIDKEKLSELIDGAFIALHGRPGEDGALQQFLMGQKIPFNGSGPLSSSLTIHKYNTLQKLKEHGFVVADQALFDKVKYLENNALVLDEVEQQFSYPFIAKPVDDGCSSAVALIKNRAHLAVYFDTIFREGTALTDDQRSKLGLAFNEEFPNKEQVLIEERITKNDAKHFLEVTGGLLTKKNNGSLSYEIFEPSEALAGEEILSLEEKFLAGEGQNITPARFGNNADEYHYIAEQVKNDLKKAAKILNVEGYARIDAFVRIYDENVVETIIIEVNSLPGMTPATCIFHQCAINGYKPYDFIDKILEFGFINNESL